MVLTGFHHEARLHPTLGYVPHRGFVHTSAPVSNPYHLELTTREGSGSLNGSRPNAQFILSAEQVYQSPVS